MAREILSDEVIFEKVKNAIVEALGVEEEEVKPDASLIDDLGAESLDFLDIGFRLDKEFGIRSSRSSIFAKATQMFGEDVVQKEGALTEIGAQLLKERMPEIEPSKIKEGLSLAEIPRFFTVETMVRTTKELLSHIPSECPGCGSASLLKEGAILKCNDCQKEIAVPSGDELVDKFLIQIKTSGRIG